jgi:uncharacterized protein YbjT (DUF2867 family)
VARTAAAAVTAEAARNSVLPVGGPEALSPLEVVRIFEKQAGRKWSVDHVPLDALRAQKAEAPDEVKEAVAALQIMYASSRVAMDPTTYLVRSRLTTVADYARSVLARVPSGS